ncbi:MurR/RpiR family transcriptional regulator [Mangrovicoccus sp. HB161399]|uniref:MurR/RpiR family transcriptional regulator n=1 Tax=Mangrovicoccus sp. HB161399 TaxID=2720392 RepID=UPI001551F911|nr:MurR/RpiR family transcriptional regulator [Mangrovicoccus sp. HB161399]
MDPTRKTRILAALKDGIAEMTPQLRQAAKYIIDHPSDVGIDPIRDTARKAGVSTYTLVKLGKTLGFPGYNAFREPFRQALLSSSDPGEEQIWLTAKQDRGDLGQVYAAAAANAMGIVSRSLEHQDLETIEAMTTLLAEADRVYLTAVRASYAMAYYFHYVGRMALPSLELIPRHQNTAIDDLNDARPGDVLLAIAVTPYSRETVEACEFAQRKGLKLLLISDSEVISPLLRPEHVLVISVQSTHSFGCFAGMMAVIEVLLAMLMHRGGAAARSRIESYDRLREATSAYWTAQKKQ